MESFFKELSTLKLKEELFNKLFEKYILIEYTISNHVVVVGGIGMYYDEGFRYEMFRINEDSSINTYNIDDIFNLPYLQKYYLEKYYNGNKEISGDKIVECFITKLNVFMEYYRLYVNEILHIITYFSSNSKYYKSYKECEDSAKHAFYHTKIAQFLLNNPHFKNLIMKLQDMGESNNHRLPFLENNLLSYYALDSLQNDVFKLWDFNNQIL